ncbi:hypothetical protein KC325_g219 [Hortaea werneckii]|nr:hypothetical protein KC325_g219 [Hortaea werneckii]
MLLIPATPPAPALTAATVSSSATPPTSPPAVIPTWRRAMIAPVEGANAPVRFAHCNPSPPLMIPTVMIARPSQMCPYDHTTRLLLEEEQDEEDDSDDGMGFMKGYSVRGARDHVDADRKGGDVEHIGEDLEEAVNPPEAGEGGESDHDAADGE